MDIFNNAERQVVCVANDIESSFPGFEDNILLTVGQKYTVIDVEVHSWHTLVTLREFPNKRFNSVLFAEIEEEERMIKKIDYTSAAHRDDEGFPVYYKTKNPLFMNLPQYHFDRDEMCDIFDADFMEWFWDHVNDQNDEFLITRSGDEFYIIHFQSGTIINWYKHMGRTNTCNKNLTLADLREFKKMLLESFGFEEVT